MFFLRFELSTLSLKSTLSLHKPIIRKVSLIRSGWLHFTINSLIKYKSIWVRTLYGINYNYSFENLFSFLRLKILFFVISSISRKHGFPTRRWTCWWPQNTFNTIKGGTARGIFANKKCFQLWISPAKFAFRRRSL